MHQYILLASYYLLKHKSPQSSSCMRAEALWGDDARVLICQVLEAVGFEADTDITDDPNPNTVEACAAE